MDGVEVGWGRVAVGMISVAVGLAGNGGWVAVGGRVSIGDGVDWPGVQPRLTNTMIIMMRKQVLCIGPPHNLAVITNHVYLFASI